MKKVTLITIAFAGMAMISCNNSKQGIGIKMASGVCVFWPNLQLGLADFYPEK